MSEPLDLEPIKKRRFSQYAAVDDRLALLAEVERLRGEVARQAEQITTVRALHVSEKRWQPHPDAEYSHDTEEEAREDLEDKTAEVSYFEVCAACKMIEESPCDGQCTAESGYLESLWPCATIRALDGATS